MRYKSEDIDLLLSELSIEKVVGEFITLKRAGANYKGLCPFHQDNSPSFVVSPSKNICKCFVCGAGGNPITFYSEYKKISFGEAVEELASKYGISIGKVLSHRKNEENNVFYEIMEEAHKFYKEEIFKYGAFEALEYLSKRKIDSKLITDNQIGYAPNDWSSLYDYLILKGFSKENILKLGLAKESENGVYDSFRNRVIFPIYSISNKVIGFGGRTLEDRKDIPKYINSSENPIFTKGKNLYGFTDRGANIRKKNYSILMEGYMDVLSAHSYGFDVALAPLGTALTEAQATLLKNYTNNVIIAFDMDEAGQRATERAIMILKKAGFNIRVLQFKDAKDPDEYLKKYGKEAFLKVVKESLEAFEFLYNRYSAEYELDNYMSKQNFINRFKEFFHCVEAELEKTLYIEKLSKTLEIDVTILSDILIKNNKKIYHNYESNKVKSNENESRNFEVERATLALVLTEPDYYVFFREKNFKTKLIRKVFYFMSQFENISSLARDEFLKLILGQKILEEDEEKQLIGIYSASITDFINKLILQKELQNIIESWFRLELKEEMKHRKSFMQHIELKKIEDQLKYIENFEDLDRLYKNFVKMSLMN